MSNPFAKYHQQSGRNDNPFAKYHGQGVSSLPGAHETAENDSWAITRGFKAGVDQLQGMGYGLAGIVGDAVGAEGLREWGMEGYQRNMEEAAENAPETNFMDIRGIGDAANWAGYTIGNLAPMMGTSLAGGGAGAIFARRGINELMERVAKDQIEKGAGREVAEQAALRAGAQRQTLAQGLGAGTASVGMNTGNIYGETEDAGVAGVHGLIAGAVDALPIMRVLGRHGLAGKARDDIQDSVISEIGKQGLAEGSTEAVQTLIEQHARHWVENDGRSLLSDMDQVDWNEVIEATAAGALGGGVMGGGSGLLQRRGQGQTQNQDDRIAGEDPLRPGNQQADQAINDYWAYQQRMGDTWADEGTPEYAELQGIISRLRDAGIDPTDVPTPEQWQAGQGTEASQEPASDFSPRMQPMGEAPQATMSDGLLRPSRARGEIVDPAPFTPMNDEGITPPEISPLDLSQTPQSRAFDALDQERRAQADREYELAQEQQFEQEMARAQSEQERGEIRQRYSRDSAPANPAMAQALARAQSPVQQASETIETARRRAMDMGGDSLDAEIAASFAALETLPQAAAAEQVAAEQAQQAQQAIEQRAQQVDLPDNRAPEAAPAEMPGTTITSDQQERATGANQEQIQPGDLVTAWSGSRGDGFPNQQSAERGLTRRQKAQPELEWSIEQLPTGRFMLAGRAPAGQQAAAIDPAQVQQSQGENGLPAGWREFSPETGTLSVPRAEMPQINTRHRGAMVNFLEARGVSNQRETVPAQSLKPTQREFSPERVQQARDFEGGNRSILVSSDGHIMDGHHQWLAADDGEVDIIRLGRPVRELLGEMRQFPSSEVDGDQQTAPAQPAPPAVDRRREAAQRSKKINTDKDSLVQAAIKLGGLTKDWKPDITGDTVGNKNIPGVGYLFTPRGTSIDDLATRLAEYGYIPPAEMENLGGVPWLSERLGDELAGRGETFAMESARAVEQMEQALEAEYEAQRQQLEDMDAERERMYAEIEREHGPEVARLDREHDDVANNSIEGLEKDGEIYEQQVEQQNATFTDAAEAARTESVRGGRQEADQDAGEAERAEEAPGASAVATDESSATETQSQQETTDESDPAEQDSAGPGPSAESATSASQPIEDFGETLEGARKHLSNVRERLDDMSDEAIAGSTLSKLWPKSEIDRIENETAAALYHAIREEIPAKPRSRYKVQRWVDKVKAVRTLVDQVDRMGPAEFMKTMRARGGLENLANKVELLSSIDRSEWGRIGRVKKLTGSINKGGEMVPGSWFMVAIDGRTRHFYDKDSVSEIISDVRGYLTPAEDAGPSTADQFEIRRNNRTGVVFVNRKGDKERRRLKEFDSVTAAAEYINSNAGELAAEWERVKERDNVRKSDMRRKENSERIGEDRRNGRDVTPDQFAETFGFRGVQFGNWVKQGKGRQDRQGALNEAYDALLDLAELTGIPPKAISLNGELGLAFGARGSGGASAHYEPTTVVINLTKTRGAGSLAHEWFHALDHYFQRKRGDGSTREQSFITYAPENYYEHKQTGQRLPASEFEPMSRGEKSPSGKRFLRGFNRDDWELIEGVRPEVAGAFANLVQTLNESPMAKRASVIDKGKEGYWSRIIERAARSFENYVITRMADEGKQNDYLANVVSPEQFQRNPERYPYLLESEIEPVAQAFDALFNTMETQETDSGVALYENRGDYVSEPAGDPQRQQDLFVEMNRIKREDPYESTDTRPETTESQRDLGRSALRDFLRQLTARYRRRSNDSDSGEISLLGAGIARNFTEGRPSQLIGQKVESYADVAALAQVYRDPRFETFRVVYMRGDEVVAEQAYTSRLPGAVHFNQESVDRIVADYRSTGADGYYLLHNHPSGVSQPSDADVRFTQKIDASIQEGFRGHVVIDHNEYSLITPKTYRKMRFDAPELNNRDFWADPDQPHTFLNWMVLGPSDLSALAKQLEPERQRDHSVIVVAKGGGEGRVGAIVSVPNSVIRAAANNQAEAVAALRRLQRHAGTGDRTFLVVDGEKLSIATPEIRLSGLFTDIQTFDGQSLSEAGMMQGESLIDDRARTLTVGERKASSSFSASQPRQPTIPANVARILVDGIKSSWNNAPDIVVARDMQDSRIPQAVRDEDARQRSQGATGDPEGFYYGGKAYIVLNGLTRQQGETGEQALLRVASHEVLGHAGLRGAFGKDLAPILREVTMRRRGDVRRKAESYGLDMSDRNDRMTAAEEVLAELAQTQPENSLVTRAVEAIRRSLRKLYMSLPKAAKDALGNRDFVQWVNAMTDAEIIDRFIVPARRFIENQGGAARGDGAIAFQRGDLFDQADNEPDDLSLEQQSNADITQQERDRREQQRQRDQQEREAEQREQADRERDDFTLTGSDAEADQAAARGQGSLFSRADTDNEAFSKWFGDSKVVDENGNPMVVYHGSKEEFTEVDTRPDIPSQLESQSSYGFYLTADEGNARAYGDRIMPLYVRAENPMDVRSDLRSAMLSAESYINDYLYRYGSDNTVEDLVRANLDVEDFMKPDSGTEYDIPQYYWDVDEMAPWAIRNGLAEYAEYNNYDSVFFQDNNRGDIYDSFVVFEPEQVKSATDNVGTYDPENPDIRFSRAGTAGTFTWGNRKASKAPASQWEEENRRIRGQDQTAWNKAEKLLKRQFAPAGLLPDAVFKAKVARDSQFEAVEFDSRHLIGELERSIKAEYGTTAANLSENDQRALSEALAGRVPAGMKPRTKTAIVAMRQYIDKQSAEYRGILMEQANELTAKAEETGDRADIAEAEQRKQLMEIIAGNEGQYVHRSYQAFDDPKWRENISDKALNDARRYLIDRAVDEGEALPEAKRLAEVVMKEILENGTAFSDMSAFIKESKLGAKDLSVLKKRKDIAPEIRALLGEYADPRLNFAKSATKMGRLIWNQRFLDRVREVGIGSFLYEGRNRPPEASQQISSDGNETYSPLDGLWATPEVEQAFRDALGKENLEGWYKTLVQTNGIVKFGKTVLSPTTAARNWQSALFFTLANGHFDLRHMKQSVAGVREYFNQSSRPEQLKYLRKLKELGVVYDTPYAGEMMRLLDDSQIENWITGSGVSMKAKEALRLATNFYQYGDDFWKIIGFENEKRLLMKHAGMDLEAAEREAAERIRNTYPTYSMVGRGIQSLRRFPLAGTFVSFPAEIIRTSFNMLRYIHKDWQDPAMRPLAKRRIAGLGIVSGLAFALQEASKAMMGIDDDEEEAVRLQAAPWQRNSNLIFTGRDENGNLRYIDISFLDPYNIWKRPITAIMRDQPWEDAAVQSAAEALGPFLGEDILAGAAREIVSNQKSSGGEVFRETDDPLRQLASITGHLRKAVQPGLASNVERTWKAMQGEKSPSGRQYNMTDEGLAWVGWRVSTLDPKAALYYRSFEFNDAKSDATRTLTEVLTNPNDVSTGQIERAFNRSIRMRGQAYEQMQKLVQSARASGLSKIEIARVLRSSSVSMADTRALLNGMVPPWRPTKSSEANAFRRAMTLLGPEKAREIRQRFRQARRIAVDE